MAQSQAYSHLQRLRQQLDAANRKIDDYTHLIAVLSAELKQYRDIICVSCKEEVLLATSPISTPRRQSALTTTASRISSEPTGLIASPSDPESPIYTPVVKTESENSLPHASSLSLRAHRPSPSIEGSHSRSDASHTGPVPVASKTNLPPSSGLIAPVAPPSTGQADSPVDYNPEIKQTLVLSVVNTFTFSAEVLCTKFSRDGNYLAVALENEETHIYDMSQSSMSVLVEHSPMFYSQVAKVRSNLWTVRFSPDGKYIATGGRNGQIKIWEVKRNRVRAIFKGHTSLIRCIDFSPDGRHLASASFDNTVRMWRLCDGSSKCLDGSPTFDFNSVAFSPNGRYIAAGDDGRCLRIWNSRTGHLLKKWKGHSDIVRSVAFKPDGKGIASGGNDHTWKSWDLSFLQDRQLHSSEHKMDEEVGKENFTGKGHTDSVTSISFSPDSRWVATSSSSLDCTSRIWEASTGRWLCTLKGHRKCIWTTDFSPTGHYLVTGATDCHVILWRYEVI